MFKYIKAWLRRDTIPVDPDLLAQRPQESLRTGRRVWNDAHGGRLELLSTDEELRMTPEERWTRHNAKAMEAGCFFCGEPGRVVREYKVTGDVPYKVVGCDKHAGRIRRGE